MLSIPLTVTTIQDAHLSSSKRKTFTLKIQAHNDVILSGAFTQSKGLRKQSE